MSNPALPEQPTLNSGWDVETVVAIGTEIDLLAKTGIALLLFTAGLKLDLFVIRTKGFVSLATSLGQVIIRIDYPRELEEQCLS